MKNNVDITGIDKAELLTALHNKADSSGLGFYYAIGYFKSPGKDMTVEEARKYIENHNNNLVFNYVNNRAIFVDLSGDTLDTSKYDTHNKHTNGEKVINSLKNHHIKHDNTNSKSQDPFVTLVDGFEKKKFDHDTIDESVEVKIIGSGNYVFTPGISKDDLTDY